MRWARPFEGVSLEPELRIPMIGMPRRGPAALTSWWLTPRETKSNPSSHAGGRDPCPRTRPALPKLQSAFCSHGSWLSRKDDRYRKTRNFCEARSPTHPNHLHAPRCPRYDELITINPYVLEELGIARSERTHAHPQPSGRALLQYPTDPGAKPCSLCWQTESTQEYCRPS